MKIKRKTHTFLWALFSYFLFTFITLPQDGITQVRVTNETVLENKETEGAKVKVTKVVEGLEHPWAVNWLSDGKMIVTERPGKMYLIDVSEEKVTELTGLPKIDTDEDQLSAPDGGNQGGLMDVVPHPDYATNGWIYFTYSSPGDDDSVTGDYDYATGTALARAKIQGGELVEVETLYAQVPRTNPGRHYGSRILFPGDGTVLFSIGDRGLRWPSQDLTDPAGSIIRLKEDGGAVEDNPFIGVAPGNLRPEIYSFGHRNNQGFAMDPNTGKLWTTEHGPNGGDLLHLIEKGGNYGWPQVAFGKEYSTDEKIGIGQKAPGIKAPKHIWEDSMAPSGLAFYAGSNIAAWEGQLFAGSLYRKAIYRISIDGETASREEELFKDEIGRIRDVRQGPDGDLYVVTDEGDGGVYRIQAAD
ncbi:PQQ-dependent sugar dehydrogenase [Pleomorphovibrio marinus]|uniref:PQQ-dependent sugar dehydrogenase n=1 Tax=Pleomorphovibrio marinus TaxID=2164132 RepID=UPI000E0B5D3D|nr:PQQ-dependent sugar dehydrogenase [Pleomorphovibrio marinus]